MSLAGYNYLLGQWKMRKVDEVYIQARVPKFLTQEEADAILATPQDEVGTYLVVPETV